MQIFPHNTENPGADDWFTGSVEITPLKSVSDNSKLSMSSVHFNTNARSAWHTHPHGQTLYVTEGVGVVQKRGEEAQIIKLGDVIWTEPGEEHWHGAATDNTMTHLAIQEVDENGNFAVWGDKVTDEEYSKQPSA